MNIDAYNTIQAVLDKSSVEYKLYEHQECRSSEESLKVRQDLGIPFAIGAKALLCKLYFKDRELFATLVLPGANILDKKKLKIELPDLKLLRFATAEELSDIAGVAYGCMPPFGNQVFPKIDMMLVCSSLKNYERVAFNAAYLTKSITLKTEDYFKAIEPDKVFEYSTPKTNTITP